MTDSETAFFDELVFTQEDLFNQAEGAYVHERVFEYEIAEVGSAMGGMTLAEPKRVKITVTNDHTDTLKVVYGDDQTTEFAPAQFVNQYDINDEQPAELEAVKLFDVYEDDRLGSCKKSLAYNLIFRAKERTLQDTEANEAVEKILKALKDMGIELRQ